MGVPEHVEAFDLLLIEAFQTKQGSVLVQQRLCASVPAARLQLVHGLDVCSATTGAQASFF